MNYYYLTSVFPDLYVGSPPDIGFYEFINLLGDNLSERDYEKVRVVRRYYDIQNVRALWKGEDFDKWGNLDFNELDEALITGVGFARYEIPYMSDFLNQYEKIEDRIYYFSKLIVEYYKNEIPKAEGFLKSYLIFEREWRLVVAALRAKKLKRNIIKELQYEDSDDSIIAQMIAQKDSPSYEPPERYRSLKTLYDSYSEMPLELYQALCEWRFDSIKEMIGVDLFSIDRVLSYVVLFIIADKWLELDKKKGLQIVDTIVKGKS